MTTLFHDNRKTHLLLVDDDPSMIRVLTHIIERSFGDTIEMQSLTAPMQARDTIENELIDILLTDLEMPEINGLGLLRLAKARNALTQVLFVTGNSSLDALADALELGATDYLLKPLDQTEVIELVTQAQNRVFRWRKALAGTFSARMPAVLEQSTTT
jgi:DNA-binding NtrC family response regulator